MGCVSAPITLLYASILGLFMAVLSIRVPMRRAAIDTPWGDGGDVSLATRIRVFGNFTEYVPMLLLLFFLLETSGSASSTALHGLGVALIASRLVHAFALIAKDELTLPRKIGRGLGAMSTWLILMATAGYALFIAVQS